MRIIHENENIYDIRYILLHFVRGKSDWWKLVWWKLVEVETGGNWWKKNENISNLN